MADLTNEEILATLADTMAKGDEVNSPAMQDADLEDAEWVLVLLNSSGLKVRRAA